MTKLEELKEIARNADVARKMALDSWNKATNSWKKANDAWNKAHSAWNKAKDDYEEEKEKSDIVK